MISFTAVDATGLGFTIQNRGLSALNTNSVAANKKYHAVGAQVIISFGNQNIADLITYIQNTVSGSLGTASDTVAGSTKIDKNLGALPRAKAVLVSQQVTPGLTLVVNPFALAQDNSNIIYAGASSGTFTAPVSNPRIDLLVYSTVTSALAIRSGTESASPTAPAPTDGDIVLCSVQNVVGQTAIYERNTAGQGYIIQWYEPAIYGTNTPSGLISPYAGKSVPSGWLLANGQSVASATYPALFSVLYNPVTISSITIATPGVITTGSAHGLVVGDAVSFQTTGGLPTGITAGVVYYVVSTGFTSTAFEIATYQGGPSINTTGSQSGTHTVYWSNYGAYNGTNFYVPDLRSKFVMGNSQGSNVWTFDSTQISYNQVATFTNSSANITTPLANFLQVGSRVEFTNSGGGLPTNFSATSTYFVVTVNSTTSFQVSATPGGSAITAGSSGTGTQTLVAGSIYTGSTDGPYLAQPVLYSKNGGTAITGLTDATTYYAIPGQAPGEFLLATTAANAALAVNVTGGNQIYQQGKFIPLTALGVGIQTLTFTFALRNTGQFGGEATHQLNTQELATHVHGMSQAVASTTSSTDYSTGGGTSLQTNPSGSNTPHNNLPPFAVMVYILKI